MGKIAPHATTHQSDGAPLEKQSDEQTKPVITLGQMAMIIFIMENHTAGGELCLPEGWTIDADGEQLKTTHRNDASMLVLWRMAVRYPVVCPVSRPYPVQSFSEGYKQRTTIQLPQNDRLLSWDHKAQILFFESTIYFRRKRRVCIYTRPCHRCFYWGSFPTAGKRIAGTLTFHFLFVLFPMCVILPIGQELNWKRNER